MINPELSKYTDNCPRRRQLAVLASSFVALGIVGCAGLQFSTAVDDKAGIDNDASSPPKGGFAFGLNASTILVTIPGGEKVAPDAGSAKGGAAATAQKLPCAEAMPDCLSDLVASAAPTVDRGKVYFVAPENASRYFGGTTLSAKTDPTDPLMLQSVAFGVSNQMPGILSNVGAGAAAGFAFGPAGAWIGAAAGGLGTVLGGGASGAKAIDKVEPPQWAKSREVCTADIESKMRRPYSEHVDGGKGPPDPPRTLILPVALSYPTNDDPPDCWHVLPAMKTADTDNLDNAGWFYRVRPTAARPKNASHLPPILTAVDLTKPAPLPFEKASDYFARAQSKQMSFPVSACRAAAIELVWWQDLKRENTAIGLDEFVAHIVLAVADPRVVQVIQVPDAASTVTVLPCGGYRTSGAPSTAISDDVSALVKSTQQVKTAQDQAKPKKTK